MPLVEMDEMMQRRDRRQRQPMLVFADDGRSMGLVVDEIIDIVEERLNIEVGQRHAGRRARLGRHQGQATEVIDVGHFLPLAFADWFQPQGNARESLSRSRCCWSTTPPSSATCWRRC